MKIKIFLLICMIITLVGCNKEDNLSNNTVQDNQSTTAKTTVGKLYDIQLGDSMNFSSPVELKNIEDVGNSYEVWKITVPDDANAGKDSLTLIVAILPDEYKTLLNNDKTKALAELKGTYMASTKPADEKITRTFLGQVTDGEKQTSKIPSPATLESYLAEIEDGQWLFVSAKYTNIITDEEINGILDSLGSTLQIKEL